STPFHNYGDVFRGGGSRRPEEWTFGIEFGEELREIGSREGPPERCGDLLVALLKAQQTLLDLDERNEVVGGKDLTLDDREVDLDLVEPARVDRGVHQDDGGPLRPQTATGLLATVRRAVVGNTEDGAGGADGWFGHHLLDQGNERRARGGAVAKP